MMMRDSSSGRGTSWSGGGGDRTDASVTSFVSDISTSLSSGFRGSMLRQGGDAGVAPRRRSAVEEELTITKVRLSNVGFYGRENEQATLLNCLKRGRCRRQVVWVHGCSGSGKTRLARSIAPTVQKRSCNGVFVEGKCDLSFQNEPYSAFLSVCRTLCQEIIDRDGPINRIIPDIKNQLQDQLGEDLEMISTTVMPELQSILGQEETHKLTNSTQKQQRQQLDTSNTTSTEARSQQLKYIFRVFIRVVSSCLSPVVMLLDDIQWASPETLDLISTLLLDRENKSSLLIIGCFRTSEAEDVASHPLSKLMKDLEEKRDGDDDDYRITSIQVGNLSMEDSRKVLMDLLSIDDDSPRTTKLASLCHQRTLGNAYFFIQFVAMLQEQGLIEFHLGLFRWQWDENLIASKTSASPNVVSLVRKRIQKSPESLLCFLKVLSCLGPLPSFRVIQLAWDKAWPASDSGVATITASGMITDAIEANYIERSGDSNFRFVHDKILEAALSLMTDEERTELRHGIGMQLLSGLADTEVESEVFLIADLLDVSVARTENMRDGRELVLRMNLLAAEKAKSLSAFSSALNYALKGVSLLSQDSWQNEYETTLRLYSVGAETAGSIGQVDTLDEISQAVLLRGDVPILDKLRVYNALLDSMASNGKLLEAQSLVCELLDKLGCRVPRRGPTHALRTFFSLVALKRRPPSADAIQMLPEMTDRNKSECLRLLYQLQTFSYLNRAVPLFLWSCTKQILWTMKYGVHELSAAAFPAMGAIMVAVFTDFRTGTLFARNGKLILQLGGYKIAEARVAFGCVIAPSYYQPMQSLIKGLSASYKTGMQVGDTDSAMWCLAHSCWLQFMTGKPLVAVEEECRVCVNRMKVLNRKEAVHFTSPVWQTTLNLMGVSPFSTRLAGEAFGTEDEQEVWDLAEAGPLRPHLEICQTALRTYFGDHVGGADLFIKRGDRYLNDHPGHPQGNMDSFLKGVCLFAAASQTRKSKYRRHANKARRTIASWWKKGNPNSHHQVSFLDALKRKWEEASICYQKTITLASRCGLTQDAALANERYAAFLLMRNKPGDLEDARFRLKKSMQLFQEWGAAAVVSCLEERYLKVLSGSDGESPLPFPAGSVETRGLELEL